MKERRPLQLTCEVQGHLYLSRLQSARTLSFSITALYSPKAPYTEQFQKHSFSLHHWLGGISLLSRLLQELPPAPQAHAHHPRLDKKGQGKNRA